ncbi:MAG: thiamine-binding protein [Bacteroidota bacterium]|nr:MAG: thiamine-binding protein [Bacteroidota bacterium]
MNHFVNISLQILPTSSSVHPYEIVDKAIAVIQASGLKYQVCPFETVMEGPYDKIMEVIKQVHITCMQEGAESIFANVKMQIAKNKDVFIEDKMEKY